jgi:hypothetical protein
MARDGRKLLTVLKAELDFVQKGGYRLTARSCWRPQFIFQDSPTCLNFDGTQEPRSCSDCTMSELAPPELRESKIPCRYIPLNDRGETVDSLYRTATLEELEAVLTDWLVATIQKVEKAQTPSQHSSIAPEAACKAAAN